jgi:hypothetical protein
MNSFMFLFHSRTISRICQNLCEDEARRDHLELLEGHIVHHIVRTGPVLLTLCQATVVPEIMAISIWMPMYQRNSPIVRGCTFSQSSASDIFRIRTFSIHTNGRKRRKISRYVLPQGVHPFLKDGFLYPSFVDTIPSPPLPPEKPINRDFYWRRVKRRPVLREGLVVIINLEALGTNLGDVLKIISHPENCRVNFSLRLGIGWCLFGAVPV